MNSSALRMKKIAFARLKHRRGIAYTTIIFEDLLMVVVGLAEIGLGSVLEATTSITFELLKTTDATYRCTYGPSSTLSGLWTFVYNA